MSGPSQENPPTDTIATTRARERALVLVPDVGQGTRTPHEKLEEAVGLAEAIDLDIGEALVVPVANIRPSTFFGSGKVEELAHVAKSGHIGLVVVDIELTPVQQRNLEKAFSAKVLDRTGLILEIFGERAQTREGTLQVELAHLNYQKSRLVRSWTHLERQRGGFGFLGGPGETQIEADRRMIETRVKRIEADLKAVATRRRLQRSRRQRNEQTTIALVGYTNAGKSTLFNRISSASVMARDQLFATLDPTLRRIDLPGGKNAVLSDTVGFVADLPTTLVAAFRATLEEVSEADLILHVRNAASHEAQAQADDVASVLAELGIDIADPDRVIDVWNKIDLLDAHATIGTHIDSDEPRPASVRVSALTGEGIDGLLELIASRVDADHETFSIDLSGARTALLHRLYHYGEVLGREELESHITARVRIPRRFVTDFRREFPEAEAAA